MTNINQPQQQSLENKIVEESMRAAGEVYRLGKDFGMIRIENIFIKHYNNLISNIRREAVEEEKAKIREDFLDWRGMGAWDEREDAEREWDNDFMGYIRTRDRIIDDYKKSLSTTKETK